MKKLFAIIAIVSGIPLIGTCAIPAGAVWELNASATASNVNGGFFNPSNANFLTDYTTDSNTANTNAPVVSSASYSFVAGDVGAWLYIKSGTNWVSGRYCQIASVASNKATLTATSGTCVDVDTAAGYPTPRYKASTTAGIATVGTPTSGTIGIDYSQGTASRANDTDLASVTGTTNPCTVTSAAKPFGANHAGNSIHITAGTNWTADWYEIVSVSVVTATLDKACASSASVTGGTFAVGGAMSLNSTLDDDLFEKGIAGNLFFMKNGSFTLGETVSIAAAGGSQLPIVVAGYNSLRGDTPTGTNRPTFSIGTNSLVWGANWDVYNTINSGSTAGSMVTCGSAGKMVNNKYTNTATSASRNALLVSNADCFIFNNEAISYLGNAISFTATGGIFLNNYLHDSVNGLLVNGGSQTGVINGNIFVSNTTAAINTTSGPTGGFLIASNTLYGSEDKLGTGILLVTATTDVRVINNIVYGFATGISHADTQSVGWGDYNDYNNNTTNYTNWQSGANSITLAPSFTNVSQITDTSGGFTTGTCGTSDNTLTVSGANFTTGGVVAGRDYLYITGGTNANTGVYGISTVGTTTLLLDRDCSSSSTASAITYKITIGRNFGVGTNMKAVGFPGAFSLSTTTGYMDIGAAQRQETGGQVSFPITP